MVRVHLSAQGLVIGIGIHSYFKNKILEVRVLSRPQSVSGDRLTDESGNHIRSHSSTDEQLGSNEKGVGSNPTGSALGSITQLVRVTVS